MSEANQQSASPRTSPAAGGYLPTLDGWRAIAILGVMVAHGTAASFGAGGAFANASLYALSRYGAMGVDVFFGISGFLICSRLIAEHRARGRINLKGFYIRRFFRIPPPLRATCGVGSARHRGRVGGLWR